MTGLYNVDTATLITEYIDITTNQELTKVVQRTLDGQNYVQTIGEPAPFFSISLYVDETGKTLILQADAAGNLMKVISADDTWSGKILEISDWEKTGCFYHTTIKLGVVT